MNECICSSCKNLKSFIDEKGTESNSVVEGCDYGFPSDSCEDCALEGCELTCTHYEKDQEEVEQFIIKNCAKCNVELKVTSSKADFGDVFCVTCYLSKN